jgi:hypothetical protein
MFFQKFQKGLAMIFPKARKRENRQDRMRLTGRLRGSGGIYNFVFDIPACLSQHFYRTFRYQIVSIALKFMGEHVWRVHNSLHQCGKAKINRAERGISLGVLNFSFPL